MKKLLRTNPTIRKMKDIKIALSRFSESPISKLAEYCKDNSIVTVLDIGANAGQFGVDLRRSGFLGQIYSFEPVKENFDTLIWTSRHDSKWKAINLALGKERAITHINVSDNDGLSSSILPMGELHKRAFPKSEYIRTQEVQVSTLQDEILTLGIDPSTTLLKMDVQGYEKNVILGGLNQIKMFPICFFEASLSPLYHGEASLLELLNLLDSCGQNLTDVFRGVQDRQGNLLQVDVLTSSIRY